MEVIKALKIDKTIGSCRFVYNHMLDRNNKVYKRRKEHLNYNQMQNLLPVMKDYIPWLKEADSQALKYARRQLDTVSSQDSPRIYLWVELRKIDYLVIN